MRPMTPFQGRLRPVTVSCYRILVSALSSRGRPLYFAGKLAVRNVFLTSLNQSTSGIAHCRGPIILMLSQIMNLLQCFFLSCPYTSSITAKIPEVFSDLLIWRMDGGKFAAKRFGEGHYQSIFPRNRTKILFEHNFQRNLIQVWERGHYKHLCNAYVTGKLYEPSLDQFSHYFHRYTTSNKNFWT